MWKETRLGSDLLREALQAISDTCSIRLDPILSHLFMANLMNFWIRSCRKMSCCHNLILFLSCCQRYGLNTTILLAFPVALKVYGGISLDTALRLEAWNPLDYSIPSHCDRIRTSKLLPQTLLHPLPLRQNPNEQAIAS
ncbi:hypothetical protein TNCV_307711 [Trichonephila clavipes]|nr:hypothetical protein TNCV_307711 [Trichonephila clavipes]